MKRIYFFLIVALLSFTVSPSSLLAEGTKNPQPSKLQEKLRKKQAKIDEKAKKETEKRVKEEIRLKKEEAKREAENLKEIETENERLEKELTEEKKAEEERAKKAERARLEQELEQKRLTDIERRERLYKKIEDIEAQRNKEHLTKKGVQEEQAKAGPAPSKKKIPDDAAELMKKGDEFYNNGDYDQAREYYDKARFLLEGKNKSKK